MSTERILIMIAVSALCTFFLRALPFLAFGGSQKMPDWLDRLGKTLPSAIMAVLIVYCLKDVGSDVVHIGLPKIAAVVIVALSYKWKHNTLVSIAVGTAGYYDPSSSGSYVVRFMHLAEQRMYTYWKNI